MKLAVPLVFASAAVAMFVATSHSAIRWPLSCRVHVLPIRCTETAAGSNSRAVKDVNTVIEAAYRDGLDETLVHLYLTVNRAQKARVGTREWAFEIEEGVPGLAQRVGDLTQRARARVAAVQVNTPAGRRFRTIALRGLRVEGAVYAALARDLRTPEPTLKAFNRWGFRLNALHRWYSVQLRSVLVAAPVRDRPAVAAALSRY
jgi:hypothetical protein